MLQLAVFFDIGDTLVVDPPVVDPPVVDPPVVDPPVVDTPVVDPAVVEKRWRDGAEACLETLREAGARLGIISNTGDLTREELAKYLPSNFDFGAFEEPLVLLSSKTKIEKPKPEAFEQAIQCAGLPPHDCVFIGEDLKETWVAQSVGMRACRVSRFPKDFQDLGGILTDQ